MRTAQKRRYSDTIIVGGKRIEFIPYKEKRTPAGGYYQGQKTKGYWKQRSKERLNETFKTAESLKIYEQKMYEKELRKVAEEYKDLIKPYIVDGELRTPANNPVFNYKMRRLLNEADAFSASLNQEQVKKVSSLLEDILLTENQYLRIWV